jgi:hypothetical protein
LALAVTGNDRPIPLAGAVKRGSTMLRLPFTVVLGWIVCFCATSTIIAAPPVEPSTEPGENKTERGTPWDPADRYESREIQGWRVLVNRRLIDEKSLCDDVLRLLDLQLYQITRQVPAAALAKTHTIIIWVELAEPHHPCMAFHPDPGWLREHDMNPEKAGCVEIANGRNFLDWTHEQPWMVLHELAHGYHFLFLDGAYENPQIDAAYRKAVESKSYESVLHIAGKKERAYALTNPMEYFAETSECYFGTNDFYPFVRAELQEHDPDMFKLIEELWNRK